MGGGRDAAMRKVGVFDFGGSSFTCEDMPDYLGADNALSGTFTDGQVELCGGASTDQRSALWKVQYNIALCP